MLSLLRDALLPLHIAAGGVSLILFWLPILTKKGRTAHRRIGLVYVYAMSVVVVSAFILSGIYILSGASDKIQPHQLDERRRDRCISQGGAHADC